MRLQNVARFEFVVALRQPTHLYDNLLQTKMLRESQRPAAMRRKSGSENHSVIRILRRFDDFFFNATRRFVDHQKHQTIRKIDIVLGRTAAPPLRERVVSELLFALVFVKAASTLATEQL